jgi:hypothetical protein
LWPLEKAVAHDAALNKCVLCPRDELDERWDFRKYGPYKMLMNLHHVAAVRGEAQAPACRMVRDLEPLGHTAHSRHIRLNDSDGI